MVEVVEGKSAFGLPYELFLNKIFEWYGVDLSEIETIFVKEFSDQKCLSQSNLKINKNGMLVQVEPPPISPPPTAGPSSFGLRSLEDKFLEFVLEVKENQRLILRKLAEVIEENNFWKDLIRGFTTPTTTNNTP